MSEHFVIVGAGQAGGQAAATLRQKGFKGRLTLVGDEPYLPYQRPPLSKKFLAGALPVDRLLLKPARFFADRDITVQLATQARSVHLSGQRLTLSDGERLPYDQLLLAVGSKVRKLAISGSDLMGIHYLRNIQDVIGIRKDLLPGKRLVLIGGGYIGLEVAAVAVQMGLEVTVIEAQDRIMARVVSPEVSEFFTDRHQTAGVKLIVNAAAQAFVGDGGVTGVITDNAGEVPCDLVITGVGVLPETDLAEDGGLVCDNGIQVDEFCRTSAASVFAAGDCTNHPNALLGQRIRLESVANAAEQSRIAAMNMLGGETPYHQLPWFWSEQYELKLQIAGIAQSGHQRVVRGRPEGDSFAVFYHADGRVTATEAVNRPRAFMAGKKLISAGARISAETLADTDRSMTQIAREALEQ